jgi:hypothetical protein
MNFLGRDMIMHIELLKEDEEEEKGEEKKEAQDGVRS